MRRFSVFRKKIPAFSIALPAIAIVLSSLTPLKAEVNTESFLQNKITGNVSDEKTSEPLPGVSVVIKGTTTGVVTDLDGNFAINASAEDILIFSFIGYDNQEILVGASTAINVQMRSMAIDLSEVVFVGYGTMKKSDVTGAITSVSEDALKAHPVTSIDQALQGRAAGVTVQQTSGSPAGGVSVLIRGASSINASSQPLYVIDGVIISNSFTGGTASIDGGQGGQNSNPLAVLNPDDIVSIEILKDASATAIYGTRGANGVIAITTKSGKEGKNLLEFNASFGLQTLPRKMDVLSTQEYRQFRLLQHANTINRGDEEYPNYVNPLDNNDTQIPFTTLHPDSAGVSTDWQDEIYQTKFIERVEVYDPEKKKLRKKTELAALQNYHLLVGGSTENLNYKFSAGYANTEGILIGSSFERFSLSSKADANLTKWFKLGNSIMFGYSNEDMTFNDSYYGGGMVERALQQRPDMQVRDEEGNFVGPDETMEESADNPIAAELEKQNDNIVSRLIGNVNAQVTFFKGLDLKSTFGADISNARTILFNPYVHDRGSAAYVEDAELKESLTQNTSWSWDNYLTFNREFGVHAITTMAGASWSYVKWDYFSAYRDIFPTNESRNINLGSTANMKTGAWAGHFANIVFFGRAVYSYKNYLTVTHTSSYMGSSKFGSNPEAADNRWGYFPSFAAAWKISNHSFMQNLAFINFMKLRVGYGQAGNDNLDPVEFMARLAAVEVTFDNEIIPAFEPDGMDNPYLRWERVISYNTGLDLNMLDNRIQLNTDFYIRESRDMLIEKNLPITMAPFGMPWSNVGSMVNKGFEFSLISHNISGNFNWSSTLTYSYNKNEVIDIEGTDILAKMRTQDPELTRTSEAYPVAQFYGFVTDGIFRSEEEIDQHAYQNNRTRVGDIRFVDINGDGYIDDADKTYIGNPLPIHVYGFTNTFSYKGIDLTIFLQGMAGQQVFNLVRRNMESLKGTNNQCTTVLDAYVPEDIYLETEHGRFLVAAENTDTDMPRQTSQDLNNNTRISDRYVEDASFLKLQSLSVGYHLPQKITKGLNMSSLRVYVTGTNLHTFTGYSGYDPEHGALFNSENNNGLLNGIDVGNYPIPRSVIAGVNVKF